MTLQQTIMEDMKTAMKAHDSATLDAIRLLRSEIKNIEIDHGVQDDAGVEKIVARLIKQWQDAKTDYQKGERSDLVAEAEVKIRVLSKYLPAQMDADEVRLVVQQVVAKSEQKNAGPIIGLVMKQLAGKADGTLVAKLVQEELNK